MFEWFYWSSIVEGLNKLPRETIAAIVGAYVVLDIHKRNSQVKIEKAKCEVRVAELKVEAQALELESLKLQMRGGPVHPFGK